MSRFQGELYVAEANGETYGEGIVVKLTPPEAAGGAWVQTTLYTFGRCNRAARRDPNTLTVESGGIIYGTTFD